VAVLTEQQMLRAMRGAERQLDIVDYNKQHARDILQACEDWFVSEQANLIAEINAAIAPKTLSPTVKLALASEYFWLWAKSQGAT
jgi:hypothetical protein